MGRGWVPDYIWVVRYGGLSEDPHAKPFMFVVSTRYDAIHNNLPLIVNSLRLKFPNDSWEENLDNVNRTSKHEFWMFSHNHPEAFVEATRHPFTDYYGRRLPGVVYDDDEEFDDDLDNDDEED